MLKCPVCKFKNKEYDSEKVKCWNCGTMIVTNNDTVELANVIIASAKYYKKNRLDIKDFLFDLNEILKDRG